MATSRGAGRGGGGTVLTRAAGDRSRPARDRHNALVLPDHAVFTFAFRPDSHIGHRASVRNRAAIVERHCLAFDLDELEAVATLRDLPGPELGYGPKIAPPRSADLAATLATAHDFAGPGGDF